MGLPDVGKTSIHEVAPAYGFSFGAELDDADASASRPLCRKHHPVSAVESGFRGFGHQVGARQRPQGYAAARTSEGIMLLCAR